MSSLSNIIAGLKIFEKYNGSVGLGTYELYAGQANGKKLTQAEIDELFECDWRLECSGCASAKTKNAFTEPESEFPGDEPRPRHRFTCNEWSIFI